MESSVSQVKVSVTIPVYNTEALVGSAIQSALDQEVTFPIEVLVCDDASPDRAWSVLESFESDPRVRLFRNEQNIGCAASRQRLLLEARGEYVSICDSDDELLPGNLQRFADILDQKPELGVVYGDLLEVETDHLGNEQAPPWHRKFRFEKAWDLMHNQVPHPSTMFRADVARAIGGYRDLPNSSDWDLWLRMAEVTKFQYEEGFLAGLYRRWPGSITRSPNNREEIAFQIVREAVARRLAQKRGS